MDAGRFISASKARDAQKDKEGFIYEISYLPEEEAKGMIKKKVMFRAEPTERDEITEIDIFELEPGAELLPHTHRYDAGYYRIGENHFTCCERGDTFSYKNDTGSLVKITLVKFAVIV